MEDETETVSGDIANYTGDVIVILEPSGTADTATEEVPAPSGQFTAVFTQATSTIDLCTGAGTVLAQTPQELAETAPIPGWGRRTCSYNPPATRCDA